MTDWRRSTFCNWGNCVEVAPHPDGATIRNSTRPDVTLAFSVDEWAAFLAGVRAGEFDLDEEDR